MKLGKSKKVESPLAPLAPPSFSRKRFLSLKEFISDVRGTRKLAKANQLKAWAASMAFYSLFALVPLLIFCFLVAERLFPQLHDPTSPMSLKVLLEILLPSIAPMISENLIAVAQRNLVSDALNTAMLGWSTYGLFVSLHSVFENISASGKTRNFFWTNVISLFCFAMILGACTLFLFMTTLSAANLQTLLGTYSYHVDVGMIRWAASTLSLVSVVAAITFVFKVMPTRPVRWVFALRASLMFAGFFLGGRGCFEFYIAYYRTMNESVYGAFLAFMIVVIWVFYLTRTFLFSAQYAIYLEEKNRSQY